MEEQTNHNSTTDGEEAGATSDEALARMAQSGDQNAFADLVMRYEQRMLRYAGRFLRQEADAEDLVQEVFLKAYRNLQSFDADRRFSPWLYRVAHNEIVNTLKRKQHDPLPFFDPDTLFPHPVAPDRTDREVELQEVKELIKNGLETLTPKYREPIALYYLEEMSYREIADILHIPIGTVSVRISRGKASLRNFLAKNDGAAHL